MFSILSTPKLKTSRRIKLLIFAITVILIVSMFPPGESLDSEVSVGSIWLNDDLIASQPFEILKDPVQYENECKLAENKVLSVFVKDSEIQKKMLDSLKIYNDYLIKVIDSETGGISITKNLIVSQKTYLSFLDLRKKENTLTLRNSYTLNEIFKNTKNILEKIYNNGLLNVSHSEIEKDSISVRDGKFERIHLKKNFYDREQVNDYLWHNLENTFKNDGQLIEAVREYISKFLVPNVIYNEEMSRQAREHAVSKVIRNIGIVNENERIVAKHERITNEIKLKIDSYRIARNQETGFWDIFIQHIGKGLHIIAILMLYTFYLMLYRKEIFCDNVKLLLIAIIILLISFLTFIVHQIKVSTPTEFLILIPVASMLITILFDSRVGFYGTIIMALIAGALRGNDYVFSVINIVAGSLAIYTIRDIQSRASIYRAFIFILIGYIISIIAFGLERFESVTQMAIQSGFASINAVLSPALTYGLLIFIEKIFKITTDITLFELTDFNQPLLKELATKAPGSFNHSLNLSTIVENAALEIRAKPILARVGALYHDIGKIVEPENFIENQLSDKNIHDELTPEESVQVIRKHVEYGIKLAQEKKLPQEVINFIPMHHGTQVMKFFYEKAKEKYLTVNIDDYRYPGPKPNSAETALVMLGDACESTIKAIEEITPEKVENVINNIIDERLTSGELDDTPLTFEKLKMIKKSFISTIMSQHYRRIKYPNQEELEEKSEDNN
ncbi:MAG: HDIG domain-containing protein [Ignavibacteriales bacterium]|nr:HDIG domain-containing protein [Ignavibacteriales bacterium]